jgi:hypothetical protein
VFFAGYMTAVPLLTSLTDRIDSRRVYLWAGVFSSLGAVGFTLCAQGRWSARPVLGHADYRGPVKGLYMCGAGPHPGGGVTGIPGHNAAREIIGDFKRGRLNDKNK